MAARIHELRQQRATLATQASKALESAHPKAKAENRPPAAEQIKEEDRRLRWRGVVGKRHGPLGPESLDAAAGGGSVVAAESQTVSVQAGAVYRVSGHYNTSSPYNALTTNVLVGESGQHVGALVRRRKRAPAVA